MYSVIVYIPETHAEQVKKAMFKAGAGKWGNYDCCSFEVLGHGQFRPLDGSSPFIGEMNQLEIVEELRVEMICPDECLQDVLQKMKEAHPYEIPAYLVLGPLLNF